MKFDPRTYQKLGIEHVIDVPRSNLWADPGLGKTSIVLSAYEMLQLAGSRYTPVLVLAPLRVARRVWSDEARKWEHLHKLKVSPVVGDAEQRRLKLKGKADVYVTNYENVQWLVEKLGNDWPFKWVVADESTKLKSFRLRGGGKRAAALAKVAHLTGRWTNLTGTPAPNGLIDLWGQTWFLDEGQRLGRTYSAFKSRWFDEDKYTHRIDPRSYAAEQISAALADVTLSISARDWLDLPPLIHNRVVVDLPAKAREWYDRFEAELVAQLEDVTVTASTAADLSMKCLQVCAGAVYKEGAGSDFAVLHDEKIEALREMVDELSGAPVMVCYHFKHDLVRLKKAFPQARELRDPKDEDDWNAGRIPMLLVHPQSAGHGLNLQHGGNVLIFYSNNWNLEEYQQVIERIGPTRQYQAGIDRPVFVHQIVAADTVDEVVVERLAGKGQVQDLLRKRFAK